jgi:hypothetical protein
MGHANSAQIAMVDMGSGWADDTSAFGSRPDKELADGRKDAELIGADAIDARIRAWI